MPDGVKMTLRASDSVPQSRYLTLEEAARALHALQQLRRSWRHAAPPALQDLRRSRSLPAHRELRRARKHPEAGRAPAATAPLRWDITGEHWRAQ